MKDDSYNFLRYMTAEKAKEMGFTHHGKYFGIPCWLADMDGGMMVATKWMPFEYVFPLFCHIEGTLRDLFYPEDEPGFQFSVGRAI